MAIDDPKEIRSIQKKTLEITWMDEHVSSFSYRFLRLNCPCALCVDEWTRKPLINEESIPSEVTCLKIEPRGRYALGFRFSDGHDTGIYSFERLRKICQCLACHQDHK